MASRHHCGCRHLWYLGIRGERRKRSEQAETADCAAMCAQAGPGGMRRPARQGHRQDQELKQCQGSRQLIYEYHEVKGEQLACSALLEQIYTRQPPFNLSLYECVFVLMIPKG